MVATSCPRSQTGRDGLRSQGLHRVIQRSEVEALVCGECRYGRAVGAVNVASECGCMHVSGACEACVHAEPRGGAQDSLANAFFPTTKTLGAHGLAVKTVMTAGIRISRLCGWDLHSKAGLDPLGPEDPLNAC